jgi:hypothetical protein
MMMTNTTTPAELAALKRKNDEYNARLRAQGIKLLPYVVPCCGATLESRENTEGGRWTTLATCPECGALYMKITTAEGVTALVPDESAAQ